MNKDKSKATWDVSTTGVFIHECLDQIYKKERLGLSFTKDGWKNIMRSFNEKTGRSYEKKQLKNRLDSLRKEWKAWDKLFSRETGIAFDSVKNIVIAEDEWWERKISENRDYAKYRYKGLMFTKELEILFKDVMTSGNKMLTPSSIQQMSLADDDDDVYQPTMDLEEGSGDSEEDIVPPNTGSSVRVIEDFEGITLTTNTLPSAPSASGSSGKRKRGEGSGKSKKKKTATLKVIADAFSRIANASKDRADTLKKIVMNNLQLSDIVKELRTIPEVSSDRDFSLRCCNMMMHQLARDMYVGLREDKQLLLDWLREHAYNSPELQKPPTH